MHLDRKTPTRHSLAPFLPFYVEPTPIRSSSWLHRSLVTFMEPNPMVTSLFYFYFMYQHHRYNALLLGAFSFGFQNNSLSLLSFLPHQPSFFAGSFPPLSPLKHTVSQAQHSNFFLVYRHFFSEFIGHVDLSAIDIWMTLNLCLQPGPLLCILGSSIQFSVSYLHLDV